MSSQRFFRFHLECPNGWMTVEYRIYSSDVTEHDIDEDWYNSVSEYASQIYDYWDVNTDLRQFIQDSLIHSYAEEISEEEYFSSIESDS